MTAGRVLRNTVSGEVALRTHFPTDNPQFARLAWLVSHPSLGARNAPESEVSGDDWVELFSPEVGGS